LRFLFATASLIAKPYSMDSLHVVTVAVDGIVLILSLLSSGCKTRLTGTVLAVQLKQPESSCLCFSKHFLVLWSLLMVQFSPSASQMLSAHFVEVHDVGLAICLGDTS
jgi:hypothetical protein